MTKHRPHESCHALVIGLLFCALLLAALPVRAADNTVTQGEAAQALRVAMESHGLVPPANSGFTLYDYMDTSTTFSGSRRAILLLDADGNFIPSAAWQKANPAHCKQQARETAKPTTQLRFKFHRIHESAKAGAVAGLEDLDPNSLLIRDQNSVTGQRIDVGTQYIQASQISRDTRTRGSADIPHRDGLLADLTSDTWDKLGLGSGQLVGACGAVHVQHLSGHKTKETFSFLAGWQGHANPTLSYDWDFADGNTAKGVNPASNIYTRPGRYVVTVTVSYPNGEVASGQVTVAVEDGDIQPLDGLWTPARITRHVEACSAPMMGRSLMASRDAGPALHLTFDHPFHPEPVFNSDDPDSIRIQHWERTAPNHWEGTGQRSQQGMTGTRTITLEVVSETLMKYVHGLKLQGGGVSCQVSWDAQASWSK